MIYNDDEVKKKKGISTEFLQFFLGFGNIDQKFIERG